MLRAHDKQFECKGALDDAVGACANHPSNHIFICRALRLHCNDMQALERNVEAGNKIDTYEIEGSDRAELLQDLAEFNLAVVSSLMAHMIYWQKSVHCLGPPAMLENGTCSP